MACLSSSAVKGGRLTIHAIGAGKTRLTSKVVDHIQLVLESQRNDEAFAYFYINRNDASRSSPSAALRSIARQLSATADGSAMHKALVGGVYGQAVIVYGQALFVLEVIVL